MIGQTGSPQFLLKPTPPPSNDAFANAPGIAALPFSNTVDITGAATEPGEPIPSCATFYGPLNHTAWYRFTPTQTGSISASIINAGFSTMVAGYRGSSLMGLTELGCGAFGGRATFRAEANTTYYFQVAGLFGQSGTLEFRLEVAPPPVASFGFFPFDASVFDVKIGRASCRE